MYPPISSTVGDKPGVDYYLKPMNCPMHNLIFRSRGRSYRELPLRLFEFGTVYRYEKSGVVHGLTRVRGFTQDDAHIYCTREQMRDEIGQPARPSSSSLLRDYGLDDFYLELSTQRLRGQVRRRRRGLGGGDPGRSRTWPPPPASSWCRTRAARRSTARRSRCRPATRSAAPGRCRRSSYDFNLPERFELEYAAADGTRQRPVMIHRALFGSIERFVGVLTEHYGGAFPPWLAPVQVRGHPDRRAAQRLPRPTSRARLRAQGLRVEVDDSDDRMQKKIRNAQLQKVPFMVIAGDNDVEAGAVSFRYRDGHQDNGVPVDEAIARVAEAVASRGCRCDTIAGTAARRHRRAGRASTGSGPRTGWRTSHRSRPTTPRRGARSADDPAAGRREGLVVRRGERCFVVLNLYPYAPGHLMVLPLPARRRATPSSPTTRPTSIAHDPAGDAGLRAVERPARVQHRDEPGRRRRRGHRRPPAPARRAAVVAATRTS